MNDKFLKWIVLTNVLMALSINSTAVFLTGGDSLAGWVKGCCCAFTINTIAAAIIPVGRIGKWFAETICKRKPGTFGEMIARNFIINAIYVTIISFCMALLAVGPGSDLIPVWLSTYPILHLVGFLTSVVIEKPVNAIVGKKTGLRYNPTDLEKTAIFRSFPTIVFFRNEVPTP